MRKKALIMTACAAGLAVIVCLTGLIPVWLGILLFAAFVIAMFIHLGSWARSGADAEDRWKDMSPGQILRSFFPSSRKKG